MNALNALSLFIVFFDLREFSVLLPGGTFIVLGGLSFVTTRYVEELCLASLEFSKAALV